MKERHKNIPASYLVLMKDNKILMLQRANTGYHDGDWGLPAGHGEKGETFTDAVIREAKEEAGISLRPDQVKVVHVQHRKSDLDGSERIHTYFIAASWEGEIINGEPHKCSAIWWFDINDLPPNTVDCVRYSIQNITNGVFYSEFGWEKK